MKNDNSKSRIAVTELHKGKDKYAVAVEFHGVMSGYAVIEYFNGKRSDQFSIGLDLVESYRIMGGKVHWMVMNGYEFE